jgi:UDP-arabinose 4-epimerase
MEADGAPQGRFEQNDRVFRGDASRRTAKASGLGLKVGHALLNVWRECVSSNAILVTGGAGYVGAHTCKVLSREGYLPVVIDNLSTGHESFARWGPLIQADVRDTDAVAHAITNFNADAVLHFAASAYVGESVLDPQKYYENNVAGALSLLAGMLAVGCRKIIVSSTCAVYGEPAEIPIPECTAKQPINPYGTSKAMVERILEDYTRAYSLSSIMLRYFNACGADPDGDVGELRDAETHLIPRAMMAIQGHLTDFAVFGSDYPTPDGTAVRDYIHVSDLADAHVTALARLPERGECRSYNLGASSGYSVKEVLDAIAAVTGEELRVGKGPRRAGDPPVLVADASLARRDLDFVPKLSALSSIIATAWSWHRHAHPRKVAGPSEGRSSLQDLAV